MRRPAPVTSLLGDTFGGNNNELVVLPNVIFVTVALALGLQSNGSTVITSIIFGVLLVWSKTILIFEDVEHPVLDAFVIEGEEACSGNFIVGRYIWREQQRVGCAS